METGFIKLYRKMTDWQWYQDTNVFRIFLHLLLTSNYKDREWLNIVVKRGQRVTSIQHLSEETSLTIRQVRTALDKLKNSQELTIKTTSKYSLITIENYSKYQDITIEIDKQIDNLATNERQTNDKPMTTTKEYKEYKKEKNSKNIYNIQKNKYGEYQHVLLTEEQYNKLLVEYNSDSINSYIKYLDEYIEMKGYKAKSHYLCIKKWVIDAVKKNIKADDKGIVKMSDFMRKIYEEGDKEDIEIVEAIRDLETKDNIF